MNHFRVGIAENAESEIKRTVIRAISERFGEFSEDSVLLVNGEPECCMPLSGYTARKFTRVIDEPLSLSYFLFFSVLYAF